MSTGSSSTPVTTQTQTKDPWSGAQPYLSSMYSTAEQYQQGNVGYLPYAGQTVASQDPTLNKALGNITDLANLQISQGAPGIQQGIDLGTQLMSNYGMTPDILASLNPIYSSINAIPDLSNNYANSMAG